MFSILFFLYLFRMDDFVLSRNNFIFYLNNFHYDFTKWMWTFYPFELI